MSDKKVYKVGPYSIRIEEIAVLNINSPVQFEVILKSGQRISSWLGDWRLGEAQLTVLKGAFEAL